MSRSKAAFKSGERPGSFSICFRAFSMVSCMFMLFPIPYLVIAYIVDLYQGKRLNSYRSFKLTTRQGQVCPAPSANEVLKRRYLLLL
jgi:hypothetical protein